MMEKIEKKGMGSSFPLLQRLDRIELLVQLLEEKKSLSGRVEDEEKWKTLSSALHEIHYKGTLLERVDMIEKRLLQIELSMEMNKLGLSFEKSDDSTKSLDDSIPPHKEKEIEEGRNCKGREKGKRESKKWVRWSTCGK